MAFASRVRSARVTCSFLAHAKHQHQPHLELRHRAVRGYLSTLVTYCFQSQIARQFHKQPIIQAAQPSATRFDRITNSRPRLRKSDNVAMNAQMGASTSCLDAQSANETLQCSVGVKLL